MEMVVVISISCRIDLCSSSVAEAGHLTQVHMEALSKAQKLKLINNQESGGGCSTKSATDNHLLTDPE